MPAERTFESIVAALNRIILFRTDAALNSRQLPTLGKTRDYLQGYLDDVLKEDFKRAIRAGLYTSSHSRNGVEEGTISIMQIRPGQEAKPVVIFGCVLKQIDSVFAVREVKLLKDVYNAGSLNWLIKICAEQNNSTDIFTLWETAPLHFREQYPICPVCGESVYVADFDWYGNYRVFCSNCDWHSESYLSDCGEVIGEYVEEWYKKERSQYLKAAKKQRKIDSATAELKEATQKLLALGLDEQSIDKIITSVCKEKKK